MIRFGTGGWRAIIGDDFIKDNVYKVGQAVYIYLKRHNLLDKEVAIGYDRRFLSRPTTSVKNSHVQWIASRLK